MRKNKSQEILDMFEPAKSTGDLIKAFRKNFEISQSDMAAACGLTQGNLSSIENDKREVGAIVALKLSAVMGLNPEIILYPAGFDQEPEYLETLKRAKVIFK